MTIAIFEDVGAFMKNTVSVLPTSSNIVGRASRGTPGASGGVSGAAGGFVDEIVPVRRGSSRGVGTNSLLRQRSSSSATGAQPSEAGDGRGS